MSVLVGVFMVPCNELASIPGCIPDSLELKSHAYIGFKSEHKYKYEYRYRYSYQHCITAPRHTTQCKLSQHSQLLIHLEQVTYRPCIYELKKRGKWDCQVCLLMKDI